jgi:hypothetical protein
VLNTQHRSFIIEQQILTLLFSSLLFSVIFFSSIQALGNYLNGGKKMGEKFGFKLETLGKLKNTRGATPDSTLMTFVVQQVKERYPASLIFLEELADVEAAGKQQTSHILGT